MIVKGKKRGKTCSHGYTRYTSQIIKERKKEKKNVVKYVENKAFTCATNAIFHNVFISLPCFFPIMKTTYLFFTSQIFFFFR